MKKVLAIVLALLAPLAFPAVLTMPIIVIASVIVPPVGVVAGALSDLLYRAGGFPYMTYFGIGTSIVGFFVHHFIKTRIMGA